MDNTMKRKEPIVIPGQKWMAFTVDPNDYRYKYVPGSLINASTQSMAEMQYAAMQIEYDKILPVVAPPHELFEDGEAGS